MVPCAIELSELWKEKCARVWEFNTHSWPLPDSFKEDVEWKADDNELKREWGVQTE